MQREPGVHLNALTTSDTMRFSILYNALAAPEACIFSAAFFDANFADAEG
jgi:hypothetical protein